MEEIYTNKPDLTIRVEGLRELTAWQPYALGATVGATMGLVLGLILGLLLKRR